MKLTFHTDGRSYYDLWLKPEHLGTYYPGNSPEMMNWDSSLNKDVDDVVGRHVSYCRHLVEGYEVYETRFSRHTLQVQTSSYFRVLDPELGPNQGAPTQKCICQGTDKFIPALEAIRDAHGTTVEGLGTRAGHRAPVAAPQARGGEAHEESSGRSRTLGSRRRGGPSKQLKSRAQERHGGP